MTVLLAVLMCFAGINTNAYAAEAKEMVSVVVNVPSNWETPHLWAWNDDGTNAFDAWPGEEMTKLDDGWYYTYVPDFVQNVIVNANNDTEAVQTEGLIVEAGKAVWITVNEDLSAEIAYEAKNTAEIPEYVEMFKVHAYVPLAWKTVNMWAWSAPDGTNAFSAWPGQAMTEGEDGWFTGKAPTWVNSLIINGNEGSVQTEDIAIEGKELWIKVYEDLTYELAYEDPEKNVQDITVYAKVPADWSAPACWAWSAPDGTNAFSAWPGQPMEQDGDWYKVTAPGWINSVIVNGNEGSVQTSDLSVEAGKDIWVVVTDADNATAFYEEPVVEATAQDTAEPDASVEETPVAETPEEETPAEEAPVEEVKNDTEKTEVANNNSVEEESSNTVLIIVICAVVAVAVVAGVIIVVKKKK